MSWYLQPFPTISYGSCYFLWFPANSSEFVLFAAVFLGLKWVLKSYQNRSKINPKSSPNWPKIIQKSTQNRSKMAPGRGNRFYWFFITFWIPFWTHFGPVFDPKMTSKTYWKSHAKMSRKMYAFGRVRCPFLGLFFVQMSCIFRTLFKHRFRACVLHVSSIFRTAGPSKNTVFL